MNLILQDEQLPQAGEASQLDFAAVELLCPSKTDRMAARQFDFQWHEMEQGQQGLPCSELTSTEPTI